MCQLFALLVAAILSLFLANSSPRPLAAGPDLAASETLQCDGERHTHVLIEEDAALIRHLTEQGAMLLENGQTVDARILVKQLDMDECDLDLCGPKSVHDGSGDVFAQARESVVVVGGLYKCTKCTKWHVGPATGFVITETGAIVTNYHVVNSPNKKAFVVMTSDEHVYPVERVLAASRDDDIAILKISADNLQPLPIDTSSDLAPVGAAANVISHPAAQFYTCTSGIVSRHMTVRTGDRTMDAISITADYARGSSGAPVLSCDGEVIAIVKSTRSIYHTQTAAERKNLQMIVKTCIPARSLLRLIGS